MSRDAALNEYREAAKGLSRACSPMLEPLQSLYQSVTKEEIPEELKRLLNRLK